MFFLAKTTVELPITEVTDWICDLAPQSDDHEKLGLHDDDDIATILNRVSAYGTALHGTQYNPMKGKETTLVFPIPATKERVATLVFLIQLEGNNRATVAMIEAGQSNIVIYYQYHGSRMRSGELIIAGKSVFELFRDPATWISYKTTYPIEYNQYGYLSYDMSKYPHPCETQANFIIRTRGSELPTLLRDTFRKIQPEHDTEKVFVDGKVNVFSLRGIPNTSKHVLSWWLNDHHEKEKNMEHFLKIVELKIQTTRAIAEVCDPLKIQI